MPLTVLTYATSCCYSPTLTCVSPLQLLIIQSTLYTPQERHHHHSHPHHSHHCAYHPLCLILCYCPLLPFPLFLGSALLMLTQPTHTHGDPRFTCHCNQPDPRIHATHGAGQIMHGTDHIVVHLKMHLSKLIRLLLHHDLLMPHLQTLAFWRRYNNNGPTLSWQTCPHARAHPDISLARVFALHPPGMTLISQSIQLANTHKTYTKYQHGDKIPQTDLPFAAHHLQHSTDVPASASSSSR